MIRAHMRPGNRQRITRHTYIPLRTKVTLRCSTCGAMTRRHLQDEPGCRGTHETVSEPAKCPKGHGPMVRVDGMRKFQKGRAARAGEAGVGAVGVRVTRRAAGEGVRIFVKGDEGAVATSAPPVIQEASVAVGKIMIEIRRAEAAADPDVAAEAVIVQKELLACFETAGLGVAYVEKIPNGYWPEGYPREIMRSPWLLVTTRFGHIRIGWRKRVIELDWSRCPVLVDLSQGRAIHNGLNDSTLVNNTCGPTLVHADGYEQVVEALRILVGVADGVGAGGSR